ncbi:MAG: hypothetical protein KIS66_13110 [Fimbriimonadaceae bacterium]|nr:hypothetical protein [Fimbriimonadaceae bacterium]
MAFDRTALLAGHAERPIVPPLPRPLRPDARIVEREDQTEVEFAGRTVGFDRRTGCIRFFFGKDGYSHEYDEERRGQPRPTLSPSDVHRLSKLYLREADPRVEDCLVRGVEVDPYDPIGTLVVTVSPFFRGVPYGSSTIARLQIDPLYGRLLVFMYAPAVSPPASVAPGIVLVEARSRALEELERFHGVTNVEEVEPLELCIVRPVQKTRGLEEWLNPSQLALGAADRGILVYEGLYGDATSREALGKPYHLYEVWIDPDSGRPLALRHMVPFGGGGSAPPGPFAWNLGPAPILLSDGAWSRTVSGSVDLVPPPPSFRADRKLGLTVARLSLRAEYDARQGLLRTKVGKGYRYGRPSETVAKMLRTDKGRAPAGPPKRRQASPQ